MLLCTVSAAGDCVFLATASVLVDMCLTLQTCVLEHK